MHGRITLTRLAGALCLTTALTLTLTAAHKPALLTADLASGKVELMSAGPLAFGPQGILFVGDSRGGLIVAIDTNDHTAARSAAKIDVPGIDAKIAALVGAGSDRHQ
jgi:hypothetical protein